MDVYFYLIPLTLIFICALAYFFFWALKHKQYDDLENEGFRVLHKDERNKEES